MFRLLIKSLIHCFILSLLFFGFASNTTFGIQLTGSNGASVDFAGILSARPEGLELSIKTGDEPIIVAWEKFDLKILKKQNPEIHTAYLKAKSRQETVWLKQGIFENIVTPQEAMQQLNNLMKVKLQGPKYPGSRRVIIQTRFGQLMHEVSQVEGINTKEIGERFERFKIFQEDIRFKILPVIHQLEKEIPNASFSVKDNKLLYTMDFRLEELSRGLKEGMESKIPTRRFQDKIQKFIEYLELINNNHS